MNPEQAIQVIENALNLATTKGAFNLGETNEIVHSIITLKSMIEAKNKEVAATEAPIKEIKK
jgi:hypothetical protein